MSSLLLGVILRQGGVGANVTVRSLSSLNSLPPAVAEFVKGAAEECKPTGVHVVTGTPEEAANILAGLEKEGMVKKLSKYDNCWLARTDPKDVARVESKTVIVTKNQRDTIPIPAEGVKSQLGSWMCESDWQKAREERFPGCMTGKSIMHDPFAMRPFFGYNFGDYLGHWLSMQNRKAPTQLPKIFHVNWFRKTPSGSFLWPGFGENARVLEWIFKRCSREREDEAAKKSIIGWLPVEGAINTEGLGSSVDMGALFDVPKAFWQNETKELRSYFTQQVGADLPAQIGAELKALEDRVHK